MNFFFLFSKFFYKFFIYKKIKKVKDYYFNRLWIKFYLKVLIFCKFFIIFNYNIFFIKFYIFYYLLYKYKDFVAQWLQQWTVNP